MKKERGAGEVWRNAGTLTWRLLATILLVFASGKRVKRVDPWVRERLVSRGLGGPPRAAGCRRMEEYDMLKQLAVTAPPMSSPDNSDI